MNISDKKIDGGKPFDWGRASADYARYRDIYPQEFYDKIIKRGLCTSGQSVPDLGTGTGVLPRNMYHYGAKWVGTDISENQIEQARRLSQSMDIDADIGKKDITAEQYDFIKTFLEGIEYDDYDKLIILCDSLGDANGLCILEKRLIDTTRRYGIYPFTIDRWNKTYEYKEYFEKRIGKSVYAVLPDIEKCIYC